MNFAVIKVSFFTARAVFRIISNIESSGLVEGKAESALINNRKAFLSCSHSTTTKSRINKIYIVCILFSTLAPCLRLLLGSQWHHRPTSMFINSSKQKKLFADDKQANKHEFIAFYARLLLKCQLFAKGLDWAEANSFKWRAAFWSSHRERESRG